MKDLRDIKLARQQREASFAVDNPPVRGYLTKVNGSTKVAGQPGWVWATDQNGGIIKAFNPRVSDQEGLPVLIQRSKSKSGQAGLPEIVDVDWEYLANASDYEGQTFLKEHAKSHEWRGGYPGTDAMIVYPAAWGELMVYPAASGLTVHVSPLRYIYSGELADFPGARDVDLSSYQPAAGLARLVLLTVTKSTGALAVAQGATGLDNRLVVLPRPALPAGAIPAAYVRLSGSATGLTWPDIINARSFVNGAGEDSASEIFYDNTTSGLAAADVQAAIDELDGLVDNPIEWQYIDRCGFINNSQTSISFNDSTYVFTLTDAGAGWLYFRAGLVHSITGNKTVTLPGSPPAAGLYFIYIDATDGTLSQSTTAWTLQDAKIPVATVLWDNSLTPKYWLADERHTALIDRRSHLIAHVTSGSKYVSGGAISSYTVAPSTPSDTDNTFAIAQAVIADEDLFFTLAALTEPNGTATDYVVFYRTSTSAWSWEASAMAYRYTAGGYIQYDNAGTMTEGSSGNFYNSYLLFTNLSGAARFTFVPGRGQFATLAAARAESVDGFDWAGVNISESVIAYQLTWGTNASYGTKGKCRLAAAPVRVNVATTTAGGGSTLHNALPGLQGGTTAEYYHSSAYEYAALQALVSWAYDHGGLSGLADDDHTQYHTDARGDARYSPLGHDHSEADITDLGDYEPADANIQLHLASTSNPHGVTAAQVGLGNVDNTSDANKPVSTAQQAALDLKANLASPALTGTPTAPTAAANTNTTQIATTAFVNTEIATDRPYSNTVPVMNGAAAQGVSARVSRQDHVHPTDTSRAPLANPAFTGDVTIGGDTAGVNLRRLAWYSTPTDDFIAGATLNGLGSGWGSWATHAGFTAPGSGVNSVAYKSLLYLSYLSGASANPKGFLPRSTTPTTVAHIQVYATAAFRNMPNGGWCGIRCDNGQSGASENAVEFLLRQNSGNVDYIQRVVTAGTAVITSCKVMTYNGLLGMFFSAGGTAWTSWYIVMYGFVDSPSPEPLGGTGALSWTPVNVGLTFYVASALPDWYYGAMFDWVNSAI